MSEVFPGSRALILGPVPKGIYLLIGPPGTGKTRFAHTFIARSLRAGREVVLVATWGPPDGILADLGRMGVPTDSLRRLRIVDCYSAKSGQPSPSKWCIKSLENPSEVMISISKALEGLAGPRMCIDSMDAFLARFEDRTARIFAENLTAHIRERAERALVTLTAGAHRDALVNYIKGAFDGVIEMRIDESGPEGARRQLRYANVRAKHETKWLPFSIFGGGVVGVTVGFTPAVGRIAAEACRRATGLGYKMAWFGLVEEWLRRVVPVADSGFEEGYLTTIDIDLDDPRLSGGPTGTAARTGDVAIVDDTSAAPSFEPWRDEALRRGYRSSAAIPLKVDERIVGILNVYSKDRAGFPEPMIAKLKSIAEEAQASLSGEFAGAPPPAKGGPKSAGGDPR